MNKYLLAAFVFLLGVDQAFAAEVRVTDAWVRATAPGQDSATVALHITSPKDASIVEVSSPVASNVEIHSMTHENGMMKMRKLDGFKIKAKQEVYLGAGGSHLMLVGLKKPLITGENIELTLTLQFADKHTDKIEVWADVRELTSGHDGHIQHNQYPASGGGHVE